MVRQRSSPEQQPKATSIARKKNEKFESETPSRVVVYTGHKMVVSWWWCRERT